ncbi:uncharacterized protein LAESUDRAFT_756423 [Laetiporus sulphureus 93-53]|uniref:F-box domain-containing protein n=1 Tax=Laetiporus sulphureus 93-53 TaxID=1314785 RepID=A0A165FVF1_9APHY|nr:uncharacterized protein LAESUDRAFT_756423 [Laetiporus sulphureus 93-53]KZT09461.1 hypothetical protein LAESUDRAFT_756423 [Laetiporus sulphureus 93-53]
MVLKPHIHRIRTFSAYVQPIKFMHTLLFRLKTGAPHLEELTLRMDPMDPMDLLARLGRLTAPTVTPFTARPLFSGETPALRSVTLSCVSLPWTTPTYQNLLHLKLLDQCDLLSQITRLVPNVTRIDRLVSLPDLRELELSFIQPSYISAILAHLSLPGDTKITLRAVIEDPYRHIYRMLPKDYTAIHTLCNFRTFEIFTMAERKFAVVYVSAALNLSNVESFMVSDPTAQLSLPLPQWRGVLRSMARVRMLRFIDMATKCLSSALEALRTPYESLAGVKRNLICPELKNLEFVGGTYSDAFSSNLVLLSHNPNVDEGRINGFD